MTNFTVYNLDALKVFSTCSPAGSHFEFSEIVAQSFHPSSLALVHHHRLVIKHVKHHQPSPLPLWQDLHEPSSPYAAYSRLSRPSPARRCPTHLLNSVEIWEACRATSAASTFFDPSAVGRYGMEFLDGGTGENNPVWEVWNQAQLIRGPEGRIKCLVSIGTSNPSLNRFQNDVLHIHETLVASATETEQTAERFRQEKSHLDNTGRYYRFDLVHGL